MPILDKIKRDFSRHKAKAGVLAVLVAVMLVCVVKATFEMMPRSAAAAAGNNPLALNGSSPHDPAALTGDSEDHDRQSRELWKTLREKRGLDPTVVFTFDTASGYYNLDPNRKIAPVTDKTPAVDVAPRSSPISAEAQFARRKAELIAEARTLTVRSTVVGSGISKPVAVIGDESSVGGDRILGVGDYIKGFQITAIRAREVEFKKDGITLAIDMAHDPDLK